MDVNAESSLLQPANRGGGIDQDWAGDDQDWWDWYVTLAENDDAPIALVAGSGLPDVDPADDEQLRVELAAPYRLDAAQREAFRRDAFIKLAHVLSPAVVRRLAERLDSLLRAEHGDDVAGRFIALEQLLWVPRTSSTSPGQAIFVDQATDASVPSDAVLLKVDRFG